MNLTKLKQQFPFITPKSEKWFFNELTNKFIHIDNLPKVLAYYAVKDIDSDRKSFKQIDSFKQKRK